MENKEQLLFIHPNTLQVVRKEFGFDKIEVLEQAIDFIASWVLQQKHFVKKDFSRDYLEKTQITCKGSIDKCKLRLDKTCTIKNLLPQYFETLDAREDISPYDNLFHCAFLPTLTDKHERVVILRNMNYCGPTGFFELYRYFVKMVEYLKVADNNTGLVVILDYLNLDAKNLLPKLNLVEMRQLLTIIMDSYGLRVKKFFILASSKFAVAVKILKSVLSSKLTSRLEVWNNYKPIHKYISKDILPEDYEGDLKSIDDLHDDLLRALASDSFTKHLKEMQKATTNEALRDSNTFNQAYLGTPGSIKNISFD